MNRFVLSMLLTLSATAGLAQKKAVRLADLTEGAYTTFYDREGFAWIGTPNGLLRFDGYDTETFRTDRNSPDLFRSNDILTICENTERDELWVGTKKGAYVLDKRNFQVGDLKLHGKEAGEDELADKRITLITRASDGTYWLSYRNFLFQLDKDANILRLYTTSWQGRNRSPLGLVEDSKGTIWVALWNGGLQCLQKNSDELEDCPWAATEGPASLAFDQEQQLIVVTTEGGDTYRYGLDGAPASSQASTTADGHSEEEEAEQLKYQIQSDERLLCVTPRHDGYHWIGTTKGIYRYNATNKRLEHVVGDTGPVHDIVPTTDGNAVFVNNANGVCSLSGGQFVCLAPCSGLSSITAEGDSVYWVGSKMGNVYRMAGKPPYTLTDDTIAGNMNGDPILKVRCDGKGRLWILSANSLKEYSTQSGGCKITTAQQMETGQLTDFFVVDKGVKVAGKERTRIVEETRQLGQERSIVRTALSAYSIDGDHHIATSDTLPLSSQAHALTLFLTAFVYDDTDNITFAYRIDGNEWHQLDKGDNTITFPTIPYGTSSIEAKAMDSYGQWSEPFLVAVLSHPRPWYAYLWIPLATGAIAAGGLFYRRYHKRQKTRYAERIRKYESEKDELRRKLEEAEQKAHEAGYHEESAAQQYGPLSTADQQLLDKAKALIAQNLSNVEYGVDELSGDLCMSRMSLYRKLKGIIQKSPTDLIRETRLEHAKMLLKTTSYSINEVSDLCGFSYPSYFTKCFKELYGKSPKEYR